MNVTPAEEIAWAAGLFEGEGSVTTQDGAVIVQVKMTDEDVIRRFDSVVGRGRVYGPYVWHGRDGCVRKPFWTWVARDDAASDVLERLLPWLCARRVRLINEAARPRFAVESVWDFSRRPEEQP
jgi:hypothetical protein